MYTPTQLEAIRIFGKKDLTFGLIAQYTFRDDNYSEHYRFVGFYKNSFGNEKYHWLNINNEEAASAISPEDKYLEILGHEPHLEDVFRVAEEKGFYMEIKTIVYSMVQLSKKENPYPLCIPYNPSIPLLEQSEETLNQLISLFK